MQGAQLSSPGLCFAHWVLGHSQTVLFQRRNGLSQATQGRWGQPRGPGLTLTQISSLGHRLQAPRDEDPKGPRHLSQTLGEALLGSPGFRPWPFRPSLGGLASIFPAA